MKYPKHPWFEDIAVYLSREVVARYILRPF